MKDKEISKMLKEMQKNLEKLKGVMKDIKPKFKIIMETHEEGEGYAITLEGTRGSLLLALSELTANLIEKTNITKEDIREAVENALECVEED